MKDTQQTYIYNAIAKHVQETRYVISWDQVKVLELEKGLLTKDLRK